MFKIIRNISFSEFLSIIQTAIVISAFFAAIDTFSREPKLTIIDLYTERQEKHRRLFVSHSIERFKEFYKKYDFKMPDAILENRNIKRLLITDHVPEIFYLANKLLSASEVEFIKEIISKDTILDEKDINEHVKMKLASGFESHLFKYEYQKAMFQVDTKGHVIEDNQLKAIVKLLKPKLTDMEFYLFINAILYSREISNVFWVKNIGEIKLREIVVTVYPPVSSLTQERTGNISEFKFMDNSPRKTDISDDKILISIPELEPGKLITLQFKTIENRLTTGHFSYTFKSDRVINKTLYISVAIGLFILFVIIKIMTNYLIQPKRDLNSDNKYYAPE